MQLTNFIKSRLHFIFAHFLDSTLILKHGPRELTNSLNLRANKILLHLQEDEPISIEIDLYIH